MSFSEDGSAIPTGDAPRRRSYRLSEPISEPAAAPGFGLAEACRPQGQVGQSSIGSVRSRDGKAVYRIGWSQDAHWLAAIRSTNDGSDALIFAIP